MNKLIKTSFKCISLLASAATLTLTTGCVSGGWKTTRNYAAFVNSKPIYGRIPLYIVSAPGWLVLMIIDAFPFVGRNALDFWSGTITAGNYNFSDSNKEYFAKHEVLPESGLRQSSFDVVDKKLKTHQAILMKELVDGKIEVYLDGKLHTTLNSASELSALENVINEKMSRSTSSDVNLTVSMN